MHDTLYPDRVVIGADHPTAVGLLRNLYAPFLEQTFPDPVETPRPERYTLPALITTTPTSAELTKYAANSFLATKISFINEFSRLAEHLRRRYHRGCTGNWSRQPYRGQIFASRHRLGWLVFRERYPRNFSHRQELRLFDADCRIGY